MGKNMKICIKNITTENNLGTDFELQSVHVDSDDSYTVQQALNNFGFGWFHARLSLLIGLCWMVNSMEMAILSILPPSLHCEWGIDKYQQAFLTSMVFFGMMLSSTFWTHLSNRHGRKPTLTLCGMLLVLYSVLSSVAPSFGWLIALRALVGFAIGCIPQSVTLFAEFLPTEHREKCVALFDCFWAFGTCFEIALALVVFPKLGWRWLLGLSVTPSLLFTILTPWLRESPRFLALHGRSDKAVNILEKIATNNKRHMLIGRLVIEEELNSPENIKSILKPGLRRTTVLLWFIWMSCGFCYYGLVFISAEIMLNKSKESSGHRNCSKMFSTTDLIDLLWITLSEFPGILVTITSIKRFGNRTTMVLQFLIYTGSILMLTYNQSRMFTSSVLFVARMVLSGLFQAAYIYTPEVYPTSLKSVGVCGCSTLAHLGAMFTPFIAQVLIQTSVNKVFVIYGIMGLAGSIACVLLPKTNKTGV